MSGPCHRVLAFALLVTVGCAPAAGPTVAVPAGADRDAAMVVDAFDDITPWTAAPATGVAMRLAADSGVSGGALRVEFDFRGGGGWAAFRRDAQLRLPENYELSFWLRGDAPVNTLELKLIDESGENVWWINRPAFEFAGDWRRVSFRRRHVTFAWGPAGGGEIRDVHAIEFAITAGSGGSGTVWIDSITVVPREPVLPYDLRPVASATGSAAGGSPGAAVDGDTATSWHSAGEEPELTLDFQRVREYGGLVLHWDTAARATDYDVMISPDGTDWQTLETVRAAAGARDYLQLPETEARWLRLRMLRGTAPVYALREMTVQPVEWGESSNAMFESIAADSRRGLYPKYLSRIQSYWTIIGVNGAAEEALMNEEGAVEVGKAAFSIEPFLYDRNTLITWADATVTQSLSDGYLPIPTVTWRADGLRLDVTAWADGRPDSSMLWLRYTVRNEGATRRMPTLFLAARPLQVNPSWQFLNTPGGAAEVRSIGTGDVVRVDDRMIVPVTRPAATGAAALRSGGAIRSIVAARVPPDADVTDAAGHASAALSYDLALEPGASRDIVVSVPFTTLAREQTARYDTIRIHDPEAGAIAARRLAAAEQTWRGELDRFDIQLPAAAPPLGDMIRSNLAYVLINRDGPAIQPGSRSYERSWIRDGALTSAALLRVGHEQAVREFIEWFAPFQYDNGKVPCCVDHRGADPVPEHDSHGQLIYLIAEYFRFTGDTALVRDHWSNIAGAVAHIDSLRQTRMTPVYRTADSLAYFGMVPQSISHEGYAARPMHSYWDAFFVLRGLKDATFLAGVLGRGTERERFALIRDEFRRDLHASFERSMALHGIEYLPGAVELGDFDATSTTVGITPGGELRALEPQMRATFERYWQNFVARRDGTAEWDAYTPYELRVVGAFVRLGDRRRAHEALDWFMQHVRPAAWNHWAEVVSRDRDEPRFIGDMPHGWVGSDFIRSVTDMFAYTREDDGALVVGSGVLPQWLSTGDSVRVRGLRTPAGVVGYTMRADPERAPAGDRRRAGDVEPTAIEIRFVPGVTVHDGGLILRSPLDRVLQAATVDGRDVPVVAGSNEVRLDRWPARVVLRY